MQLSPRLDFRPWSRDDSMTNRTAVYGPVRTVVWEGRRSDPSPYPDHDCPPHPDRRTGQAGKQQGHLDHEGDAAAIGDRRITTSPARPHGASSLANLAAGLDLLTSA